MNAILQLYIKPSAHPTGINNPLRQAVKAESGVNSVGEQILLEDFRELSPAVKMEVIRFVRQKEIEMLGNTTENQG